MVNFWVVTLGKEVIGTIRRTSKGLRNTVIHPWTEMREVHDQPEQLQTLNRWQRRRLRK